MLGKLGTLVQNETKIQLLAPDQEPEPEAQQTIPGADSKPAKGGKKKDQPAGATEEFMRQHGA